MPVEEVSRTDAAACSRHGTIGVGGPFHVEASFTDNFGGK